MSSTPQFGTAEYKSTSGPDRCKSCQQELSGCYFRINGLLACEKCARQLEAQTPKDTHAAYVRGILFGVAGAFAGLILYSAFGIATGIRLGYIALAVGWLVGTAVKKGSNGIGGRRYQIAAVALTYAAVSLSAIPVGVYYILKQKNPAKTSQSASSSASVEPTETAAAAPQDQPSAGGQTSETPGTSLAAAAGALLFAGLASPFLELSEGVSGLIGLVIVFVGIRIAWTMTGAPRLEILGPFQANAPPVSSPTV